MFAIILAIANSIAQFGTYGKIINVKILRFKLKYTSYKSMNPMQKNQKLDPWNFTVESVNFSLFMTTIQGVHFRITHLLKLY